MRTTYKKSLQFILTALLCLVCSLPVFSQQSIDKPVLDFGENACGTSLSNSFMFSFVARGIFDADNEFIVELSNDGGEDFATTPYQLKRIGNVGSQSTIQSSFSVPTNITYGTYRIRIVSTKHPDAQSEVSSLFNMSYRNASERLKLKGENGETDVVICPNGSQVISLSGVSNDYRYQWYENDRLMPQQTGETLTVTKAGVYYAQVFLGSETCTDSFRANPPSNKVIVTEFPDVDIEIQGANTIELCGNETYDLVSTIGDSAFTYRWYKDDVLITDNVSSYQKTYTTPTSDQFGVYYVEIESVSGCVSRSQKVTVKQKTEIDFDADIVGATTRVMLPLQPITLEVEHTANDATYQWFKNGIAINKRQKKLTIFDEAIGEYCVEVTDNSTSCPVVRKAKKCYTILGVKSLSPVIRAVDYNECISGSSELTRVGVEATATDDNTYDLLEEQLSLLTYQWFKNSTAIVGATSKDYNVASYLENDEYYLNVSISGKKYDSNVLNLLLSPKVDIVSSSKSNKLCEGGTISLSVEKLGGFTYKWFQGNDELSTTSPEKIEVTEVGTYKLVYEGFGCSKELEVSIETFDDSVVEVSPSTTVVVRPGGTGKATASGADSYQWLNSVGDVVSTSELLEASEIGMYTLVANVGECSVTKEIQLVEDDGNIIIPNIITPFNGDGINDTWVLPNKYSFQSDVQVIIYNSQGKELINTTDYQNNWPEKESLKDGMVFYFKVLNEKELIKAGTISVLK